MLLIASKPYRLIFTDVLSFKHELWHYKTSVPFILRHTGPYQVMIRSSKSCFKGLTQTILQYIVHKGIIRMLLERAPTEWHCRSILCVWT